MSKPIPSPFWDNEEDDLIEIVNRLFKVYGFDQWGIFASKTANKEESEWTGHSNVISEEMIEYLENMIEYMRSKLDEDSK